jgi:hypothetical protein
MARRARARERSWLGRPDIFRTPDCYGWTAIPNVLLAGMPKSDKEARKPDDWRDEVLSRIRQLIKQADPDVDEERKWRKAANPEGVPVWSHGGIICTGETYKTHVKITFARGASLKDPSHLFNSSLEGNVRRAIDFHEGDKVDASALKALIREAVALNQGSIPRE